jgi:hypothetical protein
MKSLLIVCFNDLRNDARVTRQINFLKDEYKVTVACFDAWHDGSFELFKLKKKNLTFTRKAMSSIFLLSRLDSIAYNLLYDYLSYVPELRNRKFDIVVANDVEALPFSFDVAGTHSKIFFDAHEYSPRQFEDRLYWKVFFQRFVTSLCRKYIPKVHAMSTINSGIADAYEKNFGVKSILITNASDYVDQEPIPATTLPIRLVHHGIFNISRQPEIMLDMMRLLDERFTLDLIYLLPPHASPQTTQYFESFRKKAEGSGRIRILPPLKSSEITKALHPKYDVGIIIIPPVNFNYENGMPNKLFDCIQARIALAVGPLREIKAIVNRYNIGVVSPDFTAQGMASVIGRMSLGDVNTFKQNTQKAAKEMNADFNKEIMLAELRRIS